VTTRTVIALAVVSAAFALVVVCVILVYGVGRDSFVGNVSVSFDGRMYAVAPRTVCVMFSTAMISISIVVHQWFRRR
jgi:hypothetical protein